MIVLKLLIADFNLLSCEFDSFTFKLLYCVIFILIKIKLLNEIVFSGAALNKVALNGIAFTKCLQFLVKSLTQFLLLLQ